MTLQEYIAEDYPAPAVGYLAEVLEIAKHEDAENMEKTDLIRQEAEILLTPEMMSRRLSVLTDSQMALFERACRVPLTLEPDEQEDGRALSDCRYAFLVDTDDDAPLPSAASLSDEQETMLEVWKAFKRFSANRLEIPDDAVSLYETVNTPEFQARRRIASRLTVCLDGSAYLYGSTPVSVIRRVLERELGEDISEEKILSLYDSLPSDSKYSSYDATTGRTNYRRISGEELAELIQKQEGKDFYIPVTVKSEREIFKKKGCPKIGSSNKSKKFRNSLEKQEIRNFSSQRNLFMQAVGRKSNAQPLNCVSWYNHEVAKKFEKNQEN